VVSAAPGRERPSVLQWLAAAPPLVAFVGSVAIAAGWPAGAQPFWSVPELTLSEAVATRDAGEVTRLVERERVDPNRAWPVRGGLLGEVTSATPLEAAVLARREEMARLLLRLGAVVPEGAPRAALICLGVRAAAADVIALLLESGDGSDPRAGCPKPKD
jgi:hypothetical protein